MSERLLSPPAFVIVFIILAVLTVLTVGLSFVHGPGILHVAMGQSIAVAKAALVVLFFMHVLGSRAQTRAVIAISIVWLLVVLMSLTFSDYLTRGMLPNLFGH